MQEIGEYGGKMLSFVREQEKNRDWSRTIKGILHFFRRITSLCLTRLADQLKEVVVILPVTIVVKIAVIIINKVVIKVVNSSSKL